MAKKTYTITFEGDEQSVADRVGLLAFFIEKEFDPAGVTFEETATEVLGCPARAA